MSQVRYAHCEGYTDVCFTETGKFLTTGEDGDVRIWQCFDDLDNASIRVGDKCFSIAYKSGKIYVADELNEVKRYDLESNEFQGVITSFTLPVTSISVNKSNTYLVCGSSDFDIHLIDLATLKFTSFSGHDAPILHVCFDPIEKYFVSSSCDGTARFWSIQTLNTVKTLNNLHSKSNDFNDSPTFCKIAWHKDGTLIGVPSGKEIQFYERESWLCKFKINLQEENTSDDLLASIICFSPDGKYVLAATNTQMVYIHSIINKSMVFKYSYSKKSKFCSLAWNPINQNEIIFCDLNGHMGAIKAIIKDTLNEPTATNSSATTNNKKSKPKENNSTNKEKSTTAKTTTTTTKSSKVTEEKEINDDLEMEDLLDLIGGNESSNDSNDEVSTKSSTKHSNKKDIKSPNKKRKRISEEEEESHRTDKIETKIIDDDDDDDEMVSLEKLKTKTYDSVKREVMLLDNMGANENEYDTKESLINEEEQFETKKQKTVAAKTNLQPAFQSSSSPLTLPERYMVWNSVGIITQFMKEGDESIDIEFHNASYHHTIHLKNQFGYTMGDMSKEAVILASPGKLTEDDAELNPLIASSVTSYSKLACILVNSFDNHKEWSIDMPKKEYIKCVCVSRNLVACLTNRRFLRVYGIAGTQKEIICINGTPVCMAAYDNCIFVCYYGSTLSINYSIYFIDDQTRREIENGILPMSENSKLEWIGFSDEGNPYCYDSNGFLYTKCLSICKQNVWTPLSDLRHGLSHKTDNYWIVGIAERNQLIKAILCRASKYPQVLPRPTITMLNMYIPFCEPDSEKSQLEQEYWKNKHLSMSIRNMDMASNSLDLDQDEVDEKIEKFELSSREILMKMFMFSCKNGKEQRAFEVATIMDTVALQLAIKYATKTRALVLAQNLNLLAEKKAIIEYEKEKRLCEEEHLKNMNSNNQMSHFDHSEKHNDFESTKEANDNNDDIIFENETQLTNDKSISKTNKMSSNVSAHTSTSTNINDTCLTPSSIPFTTTRLNPFRANNNSAKTPLNDSSKSIINEIEEKLNKQSASKEKDTWKPTPTRKLTKSKVSNTPTSSINSFFSSK